MAEERLVEFGLISARNLKNVNYISKTEAYAVLTFAPYLEYTTQVDSRGGVNPRWDEKLGFLVPEEVLARGEAHLKVEIFTLSTLGPKFVSEVDIPIADLAVSTQFREPVLKSYPLKTNSGDYHGDLQVSFALGEKVVLKKGEHPHYPIVTRFSPQAPSPPHTPSTALPSYPTPPSRPYQVRFNGGPPPAATKPSPPPPPYANGLHSTVVPHRRPPTPPPSVFESPPSSPSSPFSSRPKPTPPFEPSPPLVVGDGGENTFPPSYVSPLAARPLKPRPHPIVTSPLTKPSPYGPPYVDGDSSTYHPIQPPRASSKFGSYGYDEPTYGPPYVEGDSTTYHPIKPPRAPSKFGSYGYDEPTYRGDDPMSLTPFDQSGYGHGDDYPIKGPKFGTSRINVPITSMNEEMARLPPLEQGSYGGTARYGHQPPATDLNHVFRGPIGKLLLTELGKTAPYDHRY